MDYVGICCYDEERWSVRVCIDFIHIYIFMYICILYALKDEFHFWLALPLGILKMTRKATTTNKQTNKQKL